MGPFFPTNRRWENGASDCIRGLGGQFGIDPERSEPQRLRAPLLKGDPGNPRGKDLGITTNSLKKKQQK